MTNSIYHWHETKGDLSNSSQNLTNTSKDALDYGKISTGPTSTGSNFKAQLIGLSFTLQIVLTLNRLTS